MATVTKTLANYEDVEALQDQLGNTHFATSSLPANTTRTITCTPSISMLIYFNGTWSGLHSMYLYSGTTDGAESQTAIKDSSSISITGTVSSGVRSIAIQNSSGAACRMTIIVSNGSITSIA